jgi:membrane-associated protease RseP (regulator of RpoE activity)
MSSRSFWIAILLAALALLAAQLYSGGGGSDPALATLRADLAREVAAREGLERTVQALEARVAALSSGSGGAAPSARPIPDPPAAVRPAPPPPPAPAAAPPGAEPRFDEQALVDAGMRRVDAAHLREVYETVDMERLYLRDRATREGWLNSPRYAEESRALDARLGALRGDLGDDGYDWFLFASGQFNRVLVADVLERSPAAFVGLEPGDRILRYGDQRVFSASELAAATTQGRAGESVTVELERGGEIRRVTIPRGPIGVRLGAERARPEAAP